MFSKEIKPLELVVQETSSRLQVWVQVQAPAANLTITPFGCSRQHSRQPKVLTAKSTAKLLGLSSSTASASLTCKYKHKIKLGWATVQSLQVRHASAHMIIVIVYPLLLCSQFRVSNHTSSALLSNHELILRWQELSAWQWLLDILWFAALEVWPEALTQPRLHVLAWTSWAELQHSFCKLRVQAQTHEVLVYYNLSCCTPESFQWLWCRLSSCDRAWKLTIAVGVSLVCSTWSQARGPDLPTCAGLLLQWLYRLGATWPSGEEPHFPL